MFPRSFLILTCVNKLELFFLKVNFELPKLLITSSIISEFLE